MADRVDSMPPPGGRKPFEDYPWDTWFDGNPWHLVRGKDYSVETTAMRAYVYRAATARDLAVATVRDPDGNGLTFCSKPKPPEPQEATP